MILIKYVNVNIVIELLENNISCNATKDLNTGDYEIEIPVDEEVLLFTSGTETTIVFQRNKINLEPYTMVLSEELEIRIVR